MLSNEDINLAFLCFASMTYNYIYMQLLLLLESDEDDESDDSSTSEDSSSPLKQEDVDDTPETDSEVRDPYFEVRERIRRELEEKRKFEESKRLAAERELRTRAWVQEVSRNFVVNQLDTNNEVNDKRPASVSSLENADVAKKAKVNNAGGAWKFGLKAYINGSANTEYTDERLVIVKDKFPKARHHYLVLPKQNIPNLKSLKQENVDILRYMLKKGQDLAGRCHPESRFRFGFHAVPSMSHLHLHVISLDMDSTYLKTKKHWNSFVTSYFVDAEEVIQQIEINGSYTVISAEQGKALLNTPLRCHQCSLSLPTMPKLKQHILTHFPK